MSPDMMDYLNVAVYRPSNYLWFYDCNHAGDGSNNFHPSGDEVADVIADSFIPMADNLIQ
jgi:hypothetical protein